MMHFSIRTAIAALALTNVATARDDEPKDENVRLKAVKIEQGDSELRKLMKERYNSSIEVVHGLMARFQSGSESVQFFVESQQKMVAAGLDLEIDQKARIAILEEGVRLAKLTEQILKTELEAGKLARWKVDYATYVRADMEIKLLKEKGSKRQ